MKADHSPVGLFMPIFLLHSQFSFFGKTFLADADKLPHFKVSLTMTPSLSWPIPFPKNAQMPSPYHVAINHPQTKLDAIACRVS
jgi:hypothetical protein